MKIVFVGAPGCGKSTMASEVFVALKQVGKRVELVPEWIRSDINFFGPMTSIWEQYRTRQHQKDLEDAIPENVGYTIIDAGIILQYFYAVLYSDSNEPRQRVVLQDMYKYLLDDLYLRRYDIIFYLPSLIAPDLDDGTRYQTEEEIAILDQHMDLLFTKIHRVPEVHRVNSSLDQRLQEVMDVILSHDDPTSAENLRTNVAKLVKDLQN